MQPHQSAAEERQRDAVTFLLLGGFFVMMALLVLLGTFWALDRTRAMVVNLVSGLVLLSVGLGMLGLAWRNSRPRPPVGHPLPGDKP